MTRKSLTASSNLDDSWVKETAGSDQDWEPESEEEQPPPEAPDPPRRRVPRKKSHSSAAGRASEFIMPSYEDVSRSSWIDSGPDKDPRARRRPSKMAEPRQRLKRSQSPPSKREIRGVKGQRPADGSEVLNILWSSLIWFAEILGLALRYLQKPLALVLALWLVVGLVVFTRNLLFSSISSALSPVCRLPGASLLGLPFCQPSSLTPRIDPSAHADFSDLVKTQDHFEDLLEKTTEVIGVPHSLKNGEISVRDLRSVVEWAVTPIPSKQELLLEINDFIDTSNQAVNALQKFNAHVGRACDSILSSGRWTQRALDDLDTKEQETASHRSHFAGWFAHYLLYPFQPVQFTHSALLDVYILHTSKVEDEIHRLLEEAQALLQLLQALEERLFAITDIVNRDDNSVRASRDEVLASIWTKLGGNRAKLSQSKNQLKVLRSVTVNRDKAWQHVTATILRLQQMQGEIEVLKERLGSAGSLPDRPDVPLRVHVDSVRLGVERLEAGRMQARELERSHLQKYLDRPRDGEVYFIDS